MLDWLRSKEEAGVRRHEQTLRDCVKREDAKGLRELALGLGASIFKLYPG